MVIIKNKGVSDVVASVLLILLTVAAIALLIQFIVPFVKNNLSSSTECLAYQSYFQFEQKINDVNYNCYKNNTGGYLIGSSVRAGEQLSTKDMDRLDGFLLVYSSTDWSESVNVISSSTVKKTQGGIWDNDEKNKISLPASSEIITYVYNSAKIYSKANIYPVLKSGRTCDASDEIKIDPCKNGVAIS